MHDKRRMSGREVWGALGPGLLMAGAAIGVSHLVQSTRAGADFGWQLVWVVIAINLVKYPFFAFGHHYAIATGNNLLDGYLRLGRFWLGAFLVLNLITALASVAGVTFVTAALLQNLVGGGWGVAGWSAALMVGTVVVLLIGHYQWLDASIKWVVVALSLATLVAFAAALVHGPSALPGAEALAPSPWDKASLGFIIALMGWMPAPIELSVWQSLWIQAKERATGVRATRQSASWDFNIGYGLTMVTAMLFLGLGALVMFGTGVTFSDAGAAFAGQVVRIYTSTIGEWSGVWIGVAALAAMVSTSTTVIDAYPRSLAAGAKLMMPSLRTGDRALHGWVMVLCCAASLVIVFHFQKSIKGMVDWATTIAFLTAPLFAWLNYRLMTDVHLAPDWRPGPFMRLWCWASLVFLTGFGVLYVLNRFGPESW
jgi:Mn2+/Fe2+ NRAMP family transporter